MIQYIINEMNIYKEFVNSYRELMVCGKKNRIRGENAFEYFE